MTHADPNMSTFEWTPPGTIPPAGGEAAFHSGGDLADDLLATLENRGLTAADLVRKVAREVCDWLNDEGCADAAVGSTLVERELALMGEAHGWRGPVARFLAALTGVCADVPAVGGPELREALSAECARWLESGTALLPDRGGCGAELLAAVPRGMGGLHPAAGLESGETILIHGWSETVARAVELAQAKGLVPEIIVSEGGPDLGGRRLARRLVASGLAVRFIYDAALIDAVKRVDRVWLGTEAIGRRAFVARVGTQAVLEQARALDVPSVVLATSDKFVPDGSTAPPTWSEEEPWHLWEGAPHGVTVESQSFESVPLELASLYATDEGLFGAQELARRAAKYLAMSSQ